MTLVDLAAATGYGVLAVMALAVLEDALARRLR